MKRRGHLYPLPGAQPVDITRGEALRDLAEAEHDMAYHKQEALNHEAEAIAERAAHGRAWKEANQARMKLGMGLLDTAEMEF